MAKINKYNKLIFIISIILIFAVIIIWSLGLYDYINKSKKIELDLNKKLITEEKEEEKSEAEANVTENSEEKNAEEKENPLNISPETTAESEEKNIENILLLGVDKQENASDTIIIVSLRKDIKTLKFVSIMRDTYVYQGEGKANKINYAYHYGGVEGSVATVNKIFNLDISKYIKVSFEELIKIVDYIGGVDIKINEEERRMINSKCSSRQLAKSGNVNLNGEQALAYSRIRKIDSDYRRTERQRNVMMSIFTKSKNVSVLDYPKVISELTSTVETNLTTFELIKLTTILTDIDLNNIGSFRIPLDGTTSDNSSGVYHLDWDKEVNVNALHDYIYN
ncbi:LCP family protein [uncultured Clostridium sp.]|uniref:LCP family protein n=1 Tax=uncultured Clostridium sp. TaxID=59620 RepID=UPI0025ECE41C|nr:LCP family protein [uncultured Clostridium sp.]